MGRQQPADGAAEVLPRAAGTLPGKGIRREARAGFLGKWAIAVPGLAVCRLRRAPIPVERTRMRESGNDVVDLRITLRGRGGRGWLAG
ncbi:hypothetical protein [Amycolatopsis sp. NPDC051903]|uniref:hypothetical protein n=1 Tax=Amycolatopsis sp. NPDC051903 TaxID=3363936 RepID=UPI0037BCB8A0